MNKEEIKNVPLNKRATEENASLLAHEVIEHCIELKGLGVMLYKLYYEMEHSNYFESPKESMQELLDAVYFTAKSLDRLTKELNSCTEIVGC